MPPEESVLRVGTWNMSHWTRQKAVLAAGAIGVDILAIQETQLAAVPLEVAHTTARHARLHLHHGPLHHGRLARQVAPAKQLENMPRAARKRPRPLVLLPVANIANLGCKNGRRLHLIQI